MATSKEYFDYIQEQLSRTGDVSYRKMMGEYIVYCQGKVIGGLYDDRFLVKPTPSAVTMMPTAGRELPYEGAKEMLLVGETDDPEFLSRLLPAIAGDLPQPKPQKR